MSAGAVGLASMAALTACAGAASSPAGNGAMAGAGQGSAGGQAGAGQGSAAGLAAGGGQQSGSGVSLDSLTVGSFVTAKSADGKPLIVARPKADHVVAFSAICTHMGCQVAPSGKHLSCPCHGSQFNPMNGHVLKGPATKSLPKVPVHLQGQQVTFG
jgi:cytochrome b6-f complex iron-sulfur subunit